MRNLFKKNNQKGVEKDPKKTEIKKDLSPQAEGKTEASSSTLLGVGGVSAHKILKGFYVSEKSAIGNTSNQYAFRISRAANKSEVKKEVTKLFNVKVKRVRILNMPEKRRDLGKHPGAKSGFKKAIVVLKEGYVIGQAKP